MSFIQNLFTSRDNNVDSSTTVGHDGRLWWDPVTNAFYSSDGTTPGGTVVGLAGAGSVGGGDTQVQFSDNGYFAGSPNMTFDEVSGLTVHRAIIGNVQIQSSDITSLVTDGTLHVHTNGTGNIHFETNYFEIKTTTNPNPVFQVSEDGDVHILAPDFAPSEGALSIVGSADGNTVSPQLPGVMLHLTGQPTTPSRIYNDGANAYAAYIGRRYNGTTAAPSQILSGDIISRIGATPYLEADWPAISTSRIDFKATENQTTANQGTGIEFWGTSTGSNVISRMLWVADNALTFYDGTTQATAGIPLTQKGNALGVATLDASSKVPLDQLPAGAMVYKGTWNASTNTPTLADGVGTSGWEYAVDVGGTQNLGSGAITFVIGDWVAYNGTEWHKIAGAVSVISFNTRTGAIILSSNDVTTALAYTPYNGATNPNGYVNASAAAAAAPVQSVFSRAGDVTLTSNDVTTALSAGSLVNAKLANSNVILGSTTLTLGDTVTTVTGLTALTSGTLTATGNVNAGNANLGNTATANYFSGDGSLLTNVPSSQIITTWIPTLVATGGGTFTYSVQGGQYIKVGRNITCYYSISISGVTGVSGTIRIGGLPYISVSAATTVGGGGADNYSFALLPLHITGLIPPTASYMDLYWHDRSGSTNTIGLMTTTNLGTTATIIGRFTYISAV